MSVCWCVVDDVCVDVFVDGVVLMCVIVDGIVCVIVMMCDVM